MRPFLRFAGFATASFSALLVAGVIASGSARADAVAPEPVAINCTDQCGCTLNSYCALISTTQGPAAAATRASAAVPTCTSCGCVVSNGLTICKAY